MKINLGRYLLVYVLAALSVWLIGAVLQAFAGFEPSSMAGTVVPPMVAATVEGQSFGRKPNASSPPPDTLWLVALMMTLAILVINLLFIALLLTTTDFAEVFSGVPAIVVVVIGAMIFGLILLLNRFMLAFGIRSALKQARK